MIEALHLLLALHLFVSSIYFRTASISVWIGACILLFSRPFLPSVPSAPLPFPTLSCTQLSQLTPCRIITLHCTTHTMDCSWSEQFGEPLPEEEPLENVIDQPQMVPPEEFVHPYALKPWYWRWAFVIKRMAYLLSLLLPFMYKSIRLSQVRGEIFI